MSLIFKPKIPERFIKPVGIEKNKHTSVNPFTKDEINLLVELRALNMPYEACGKILKRCAGNCSHTVFRLKLYSRIDSKRQKLIDEVLDESKDPR